MQKYIEKWLQIMWRISGVKPPTIPVMISMRLDTLFLAIQDPFQKFKAPKRKNFMNYNYTFHRFFQMLGVPKYSMFFPLIKSKSKLAQLDATWQRICTEVQWPMTPLLRVPEFAICNPDFDINRSPQRKRQKSSPPEVARSRPP